MTVSAAEVPLYDQPAHEPPLNVESNFTNPENLMGWIIGVAVSSMALMLLAMASRVFAKLFLMKEWRHEDYWAVLALVGAYTWDILFVYTASLGLSRHQWDVRMVDMPRLLELTNICEIIYGPTMFAAKLSVLLQLKRIFCGAGQRDSVWWIIMVLMFVVLGFYTASFFTFVFQCWPRAKIQYPLLEGTCVDPLSATLSAGVINLITDVGILIAPLFAIWRLQMPVKRKIGVTAVFGVGLFACVLGLLGMIWRLPLITSTDFTWIIAKVGVWAMAEYFAIIIVGCMPSLPMLGKTILGRRNKNKSQYIGDESGRGTNNRKRVKKEDPLWSDVRTRSEPDAAYINIDDTSPLRAGSNTIELEPYE